LDEPQAYDFPVWEVARATSAAPTYFEAARVTSADSADPFALVDGGVFANNPSMCALADVRLRRHEAADPHLESVEKDGVDPTDMVMVSLGTGELTKRLSWGDAKDWGYYGWGRQLLGVVMDGVSDTAHFQCRQLLDDRYVRFQIELEAGTTGLDDATPGNVEALAERAKELVGRSGDEIDRVCELLS
jgi:patatin-like phospholipase/acyl hydrolase